MGCQGALSKEAKDVGCCCGLCTLLLKGGRRHVCCAFLGHALGIGVINKVLGFKGLRLSAAAEQGCRGVHHFRCRFVCGPY